MWALVEARRDPDLQAGAFVGAPTSVGFAVRRDEPKLRAALDAYVGNVRRTPTWSRLVVKYFGESGLDILRRSREQVFHPVGSHRHRVGFRADGLP